MIVFRILREHLLGVVELDCGGVCELLSYSSSVKPYLVVLGVFSSKLRREVQLLMQVDAEMLQARATKVPGRSWQRLPRSPVL